MIRTVFLDAGGVLVHPDWSRIAALLAPHGLAVEPAHLARAELVSMREIDEAHFIAATSDSDRWSGFMRRVFRNARAPEPGAVAMDALRAAHEAENLWAQVPDEVVPALERLRASGRRLVVVSNANGTVRATLERVGLGRFFDGVVDSGEEGIEKPDPRIFLAALARFDADPTTTVHVGDLFHVDVVGARAAGLRAVLVDKAGLHADRPCERVRALAEVESQLDRD